MMASIQEPAVVVRSAYKFYGSKKDKRIVLNHLNMTVDRGSIYGLLGSSGCGKTTLLSCVVGRRDLMSGSIEVLSGTDPKDVPRCIGYMPQEVALIGEFSVKDAVYFFGRIYGLSESKLEERFSVLSKLLDLPDENRYIKNCSGGQQRRVSFAAALVHEPELLILDEPTVGLDPVLRANIWDHLIGLATKCNVAVIITTHYIEEARQAQKIGLMRGGKLLAEASPEVVMRRYGCETLEEAFLLLSIKQSKTDGGTEEPVIVESTDEVVIDKSNESVTNHYDSSDDFSKIHSSSKDVLTNEIKPKVKNFNYGDLRRKKMKALLFKNMQQFGRHPGGFIFSMIFPLIQLLSFFIAVGHEPREIRVGIVNDEVPNWSDCLNITHPMVVYDETDFTCHFEKLSCKYLKAFDEGVLIKNFYSTLDDGINAVKRGEVLGTVHLASNFSASIEERQILGRDTSDGSIESSIAYFWLDMSNHQLAYFFKQMLYRDYVKFGKEILTECQSSPRLGDIPLQFKDPVYGSLDTSYTEFMMPGVMLTILFFLATTVTSTILIIDKLEGIWDRSIVAGVESFEILSVHLILQTGVILIQTLEIMAMTFIGYQIPYKGDMINIFCILFFQGVAGMCFGFLISIICDSYTVAFFVSTGSFYPMIMLCGIMWPVEGMTLGVRYIAKLLPFTIPIMAIRDVMEKGHTIYDPIVYTGHIITFAWIIVLMVLCNLLLKWRRK